MVKFKLCNCKIRSAIKIEHIEDTQTPYAMSTQILRIFLQRHIHLPFT